MLAINTHMPLLRYHIVDQSGDRWESNIPEHSQAAQALEHLKLANPHTEFTIQTEQIYTVEGLGRDPDLH